MVDVPFQTRMPLMPLEVLALAADRFFRLVQFAGHVGVPASVLPFTHREHRAQD
jgi:hypothetical protein